MLCQDYNLLTFFVKFLKDVPENFTQRTKMSSKSGSATPSRPKKPLAVETAQHSRKDNARNEDPTKQPPKKKRRKNEAKSTSNFKRNTLLKSNLQIQLKFLLRQDVVHKEKQHKQQR